MYRAYMDGMTLYNPAAGYLLGSPKVKQELNKVGSFDFDIYPTHPHYSLMKKMKSVIEVWDEQQIVFRGRILNDEEGLRGEKSVECESDLAYLLDSRVRPYDYQGTLSGLFAQLLEQHNGQVDESKQWKPGTVTVTDSNDYVHYSSTQYPTTWDEMTDKLIKTHGGYLIPRYEDDGAYLDYLQDSTLLSNQPVDFGKNLLDYARTVRGEDLFTAIVPLGAKPEGESEGQRLTIADVNGGVDYIQDDDAVALYGFILGMQEWDDVTDANNLKTKGAAALAEAVQLGTELELSAADLSAMDSDYSSFHLGTYVKANIPPRGISSNFLVSKLSIELGKPQSSKLSLGKTGTTLTEEIHTGQVDRTEIIQSASDQAVKDLEQVLSSAMIQTEESIMTAVEQAYFSKDDAEDLQSSISTRFEQTAEDFTFTFNQFQQDLEDLQDGVDTQFSDISKYIRFVDGTIELGKIPEAGEEDFKVIISNEKISFLQNNLEVAYISNQQLFITNANVTTQMQIGNFAWMPRNNGNMTLRYIGGGA